MFKKYKMVIRIQFSTTILNFANKPYYRMFYFCLFFHVMIRMFASISVVNGIISYLGTYALRNTELFYELDVMDLTINDTVCYKVAFYYHRKYGLPRLNSRKINE